MNQLRQILKYPGAKWRIADWIIDQMPPHKSYLEPYFGSGAVFFRKSPSRIETINDLDGDVVNLFQCVREQAKELAAAVMATPFSREEYNAVFELPTAEDPVEQARRFLIQHWQGHGFRTGAYKSGWKNDIAGREYAYAVRYWNQLPEWIMRTVIRLKEAQIECRSALEVIRRFNNPNVLIYADPPYLLSTRKIKKQYQFEMTKQDHIDLLETLLRHQGPVMLSGYDNDLYNNMLTGWTKLQHDTLAEKGKPRTETLWLNYDLPAQMFF